MRRTVLPGGLRVVTETIPGVRSAAFGFSATTGSRDEDAAHAGSAHFLEHLLFKGTEQQVFQEVRGPRVLRVLITGPGGRRNPKSYGTHPLHGLGHYPQTTRQYGTAHQASAVPGVRGG